MVTPERRTRGDLIAVAFIAVAVLVAATLLWRFGDARATVSEPATGEPSALIPATELPPALAEVWSAPSSATDMPLVAGSAVVTADGREVVGRDPFTGEPRWRYARDIELCTATAAWGNAVTAWSKDPRYCSEVTAIGGDSGKRASQRNGDAERGTKVLFDGTHATAIGTRYLEAWRSDLVRTTQYGAVAAQVNPGRQPRSGCSYLSVAVAANLISLVERCPNEAANRLTVLKANPEDAEKPDVAYSVLLSDPAALVVAMSSQYTALLLPSPNRLAVYDGKGNQIGTYPVDVAPALTAADVDLPAVADVTTTANAVYWFTGRSTVALDPTNFRPQWAVEGTLGPGMLFAGRLLAPASGQLLVLEAASGARLAAIPVDRGDYRGPVALAAAGPVVLEQRGPRLVALR